MPHEEHEPEPTTPPDSARDVGDLQDKPAPTAPPPPIDVCAEGANATLAACMLGPFQLRQRGQVVNGWNGHKTQPLLKYLLAHRDRPVPRDALVELLWPDADPDTGRRNLHQAVYSLRRILRTADPDTQHITFRNDCYVIDDEIDVWCDVDLFERFATSGRGHNTSGDAPAAIESLTRAAAYYRGDYLADSPYDEWTVLERERLRMLFHEAMDTLGDLLVSADRWDEAIAASQQLLNHDPLAETAHRRLITAYAAKGQRSLAIHQYRLCEQALERELGLKPSAETAMQYTHAVQLSPGSTTKRI
ncbi:MAG: BTAD domain-containing putative transcriptional regulator [Actinomycetota bacterium]|nr:BTAD domain-containing putative transcriptional regulator [Actinomycetota bacterium]